MTPEEMKFWEEAVKNICHAWIIGCIILSCGIGSISIKNIFHKEQSK